MTLKQLTLPVNNCWRWICLRRAKQTPLYAVFCILERLAEFNEDRGPHMDQLFTELLKIGT